MPINRSLAKALTKKYGKKKGEKIYFGMESEKKPSFIKALKTAKKEKHTLKKFPK
jgi:hypothetical protein